MALGQIKKTAKPQGLPKTAAGNGPNTGAPGPTPAPTKVYNPAAKDTSWGRSSGDPSGGNPGQNSYGGPSSLPAGERAAPATVDANGPDPVLDAIRAKGTTRGPVDNDQTRQLPPGNVPTNKGTSGASPGPKVPAKLGTSEGPLPSRSYAGPSK